jgi:hypothetical protein
MVQTFCKEVAAVRSSLTLHTVYFAWMRLLVCRCRCSGEYVVFSLIISISEWPKAAPISSQYHRQSPFK